MSQSQGLGSESNGKPPLWLQTAGIVATIVAAIVLTLTALAAASHFTIQADVTPSLIRLEDRQTAIEVRLDGIDQRLDRIEAAVVER
jgi:hypothetical protein